MSTKKTTGPGVSFNEPDAAARSKLVTDTQAALLAAAAMIKANILSIRFQSPRFYLDRNSRSLVASTSRSMFRLPDLASWRLSGICTNYL